MADPPELTVADVARWRAWLDANESTSDGVWLVLAKKGTTEPTSLTYAEALDEALCSGWIDGRKQARDAATFRQHFTPRRARSMWSTRNVDIVARLIAEGRMRPRGADEYRGEKVLTARGGHIPGAINFEWTAGMDPERQLRIREDLAAELEGLGITRDKEIITHCQTHHRSGFTYLAAKALGYPRVKAYAGSWGEWGNHPDTPIE